MWDFLFVMSPKNKSLKNCVLFYLLTVCDRIIKSFYNCQRTQWTSGETKWTLKSAKKKKKKSTANWTVVKSCAVLLRLNISYREHEWQGATSDLKLLTFTKTTRGKKRSRNDKHLRVICFFFFFFKETCLELSCAISSEKVCIDFLLLRVWDL